MCIGREGIKGAGRVLHNRERSDEVGAKCKNRQKSENKGWYVRLGF